MDYLSWDYLVNQVRMAFYMTWHHFSTPTMVLIGVGALFALWWLLKPRR